MDINATIIKLLAAEQDLTQADLAERCGIKSQNLSTILRRGTASTKTVTKLAAGLGVRPKDIIDERS